MYLKIPHFYAFLVSTRTGIEVYLAPTYDAPDKAYKMKNLPELNGQIAENMGPGLTLTQHADCQQYYCWLYTYLPKEELSALQGRVFSDSVRREVC